MVKNTDAPSSILHHVSHLYYLNIAMFIYFSDHTQKNPLNWVLDTQVSSGLGCLLTLGNLKETGFFNFWDSSLSLKSL